MKLKFLIAILCCVSYIGFSQTKTDPDSEQKSIKIPAKETKDKDSTSVKPIKIEPKDKDSKSASNTLNYPVKIRELKAKKKEFSMFEDSELRNPGEIFEKRYNAKLEEQGIKIETMPDMFLGDVRVRGEIANIRCRDHQFPDGDLVQVVVNDEIFIPQLLLTGNFKSFDIPLKEGINSVVFIALNQGDSGPNTAEFEVYDDNKMLISSKRWNLLTGVKATILVIKDSNIPKLKTESETYTDKSKDKSN